ncbi:hypothetical protein [Aquibaculum arenosum]|uniref:Uncharacterized protein n=1 Tax=Aquibaculum arenosum TaxID=3032591 RepID=A0ABT5YMD0_9PROT|nr:hypothetical protein [Fodinicurvata sp. CAU 1616]MDF2096121.1 hypothetical protein [Fodinicurvata sp. CAU 1616]
MAKPFGLEPGSTPPSGMATYHIVLHSVPKPHPAFKSYMGSWTPERGLVRVMGTSEHFGEDSTASTARRLYDQVKRQLTQVYGSPQENEFVSDSVWAEERDFCSALANGERSHASLWERGVHGLDSDIQRIFLAVVSDDGYETSNVSLMYDLPGYEDEAAGDEYGLDSL